MIVANNLASAFQTTATITLALSVFRAPFELAMRELSTIINREERLVGDRESAPIQIKRGVLFGISYDLMKANENIKARVKRYEMLIIASSLYSSCALVFSSIFPNAELAPSEAAGLIAVGVIPVLVAAFMIPTIVRRETGEIRDRLNRYMDA